MQSNTQFEYEPNMHLSIMPMASIEYLELNEKKRRIFMFPQNLVPLPKKTKGKKGENIEKQRK